MRQSKIKGKIYNNTWNGYHLIWIIGTLKGGSMEIVEVLAIVSKSVLSLGHFKRCHSFGVTKGMEDGKYNKKDVMIL